MVALFAAAISLARDSGYEWHSVLLLCFLGALVFSLLGDVFLMLPRDLFVAGLGSFLVAHILYVVGFASVRPLDPWWVILVTIAAVGIVTVPLGRRIVPGIEDASLRGAVIAYIVVIGLMAAFAWSAPWRDGWPLLAAISAGVGATLFVASDSMIGWSRFVSEFPHYRLATMVTYHLGQIGLILSLAR